MKDYMRKILVITLVLGLTCIQPLPTYAWGFDDVLDEVEDAADSAADWADNAADDAADWADNAADDAADWADNAADDAADWADNAADDAADWADNAADDAANWADNAVDDASSWADSASEDVANWLSTSVEDTQTWTDATNAYLGAGPVEEARTTTYYYEFDDDEKWVETDGQGWEDDDELSCDTSGHGNAIIDGKVLTDFEAETQMRLDDRGNAGFVFRVSDYEGTKNEFKGYMAGIGFNGEGRGEAFIGKIDYGWKRLKTNAISLNDDTTYTVKVVASGPVFKLYVNDMLAVTATDTSFRKGHLGFQVYNSEVEFDNLLIREFTADVEENYDFRYEMPEINYLTENWLIKEHGGTSQLRGQSRGDSEEYAVIEDNGYSDMLLNVDITPTKDDGNSGVLFHVTDMTDDVPNDGYYLALEADDDGSGLVVLYSIADGGEMNRLELKTAHIMEDEVSNVEIRTLGSEIQVTVNKKMIMQITDKGSSEGFVGLATRSTASYFDNLNVFDLSGVSSTYGTDAFNRYMASVDYMVNGTVLTKQTSSGVNSATTSVRGSVTLEVTTGLHKNADSDSEIYALIEYKDGSRTSKKLGIDNYDDFEKGKTTSYDIDLEYGKTYSDIAKFYLRTDGTDGWYISDVGLYNSKGEREFFNYVGQWLDKDAPHASAIDILQLESVNEVIDNQAFNAVSVRVTTATEKNADSDSDIYLYFIYNDNTRSETLLGYDNYDDFELGMTTTYHVALKDGKKFSDISGVYLRTAGTDGWKIASTIIYDPLGNVISNRTLNTWIDNDEPDLPYVRIY